MHQACIHTYICILHNIYITIHYIYMPYTPFTPEMQTTPTPSNSISHNQQYIDVYLTALPLPFIHSLVILVCIFYQTIPSSCVLVYTSIRIHSAHSFTCLVYTSTHHITIFFSPALPRLLSLPFPSLIVRRVSQTE